MMPIDELAHFITAATEAFRKGPSIEQKRGVTHVNAMPPVQELRTVSVDVYFFVVGFTEAAAAKDHFIELVKNSEQGYFVDVSPERLKAGPSYIELGGWLGSQDLALRFMALIEHYRFGKVMTPSVLFGREPQNDEEREKYDEIAGNGLLLVAVNADGRAALGILNEV